jgi:hypothetical protein
MNYVCSRYVSSTSGRLSHRRNGALVRPVRRIRLCSMCTHFAHSSAFPVSAQKCAFLGNTLPVKMVKRGARDVAHAYCHLIVPPPDALYEMRGHDSFAPLYVVYTTPFIRKRYTTSSWCGPPDHGATWISAQRPFRWDYRVLPVRTSLCHIRLASGFRLIQAAS